MLVWRFVKQRAYVRPRRRKFVAVAHASAITFDITVVEAPLPIDFVVVGMLEYEPKAQTPRKHREFLFERSRFKEVLPIKSKELKNKIQLTYRVQYVQVSETFFIMRVPSIKRSRRGYYFSHFRMFACRRHHCLKKICSLASAAIYSLHVQILSTNLL